MPIIFLNVVISRAVFSAALPISLLWLFMAVSSAFAQVPPVVPIFPHDQTLVPGQLYYREINFARFGHFDWHNGSLYSAAVGGGARREFRFSDPSDPSSLYVHDTENVPVISMHDTHGHTKIGDFMGVQIQRIGVNENAFTSSRDGMGLDQPIPEGAQDSPRTRHHRIFYPWATPFHWSQYGESNGWGWVYRHETLLHEWDLQGQTGVLGNTILLGNLLFNVAHEQATGIAVLDIAPMLNTPSADPILVDKLSGNVGAYLAAVWENYIVLVRRDTDSLDMIDISDPQNLRFVDSIPLYQGDNGVPYVQFQDNYAFVWGHKINMETRQVEMVLDSAGDGVIDSSYPFASALIPRPSGSASGPLEVSQYNLPMGNLLITGGHGTEGVNNGIGVWAHQAAPDTKRPYVGYHLPRPGQTNFPQGAPVSIMIHETLESYTMVNGESIILRPVGSTQAVDCWISFSHDDVLTITPKDYLQADTEYEVILVDGGIKDVSGNGIVGYSFAFSTGDTSATANLPPEIHGFSADASPIAPAGSTTFSVNASDPEGTATLEYRFSAGDGSALTAWGSATSFQHTYAAEGHYGAKVQVREQANPGSISAAFSTLTVMDAPPAQQPTRSEPMAIDPVSGDVWVVNPDNDSLARIDAASHTVALELNLRTLLDTPYTSIDPRSIAIDALGQLWVTCYDADLIIVLDASGQLLATFDAGHGSAPVSVAVSPDGQTIYATTEARGSVEPTNGNLYRFTAAGALPNGVLELGYSPHDIAVSADGSRIFVSRFLSGVNHGEIWEVAASNLSLVRTINLYMNGEDRSPNDGPGVPNYVGGLCIDPHGEYLWYSAVKVNDTVGLLSGVPHAPDSTVRAMLGRIDLQSNQELYDARIDVDNSDSPKSISFSPNGDWAFVALQGNNAVAVYDQLWLRAEPELSAAKIPFTRLAVDLAPQGLRIDPATNRLYAKCLTSRSVTVLELGPFFATGAQTSLNRVDVPTVAVDRFTDEERLGKQIFYNAADAGGPLGEERMSFESYISCASCHIDGSHDGRTWDFTQRGEGLRNNIDLRGRKGEGHGNVHWSANFDEVQDFILDIVNHFGGTGFPSGVTPNEPLAASNAGDPELDALAAYLRSLDHESLPRSPYRDIDGAQSDEALIGHAIFNSTAMNCASCHAPGSQYTDSTVGLGHLHDVGTISSTSGQRLGAGPLAGVDTPTLLGVWQTAPYGHDGLSADLATFFQSGGAGGTWYQGEDGNLSGSSRSRMIFDGRWPYGGGAHGGEAAYLREDGASWSQSNIDGGSGGAARILLRHANKGDQSMTLRVNGSEVAQGLLPTTTHPNEFTSWYAWNYQTFWVDLLPGTSNTIEFRTAGGDEFAVDAIRVSNINDLNAADAHRRVVTDLNPTEQAALKRFLVELDGSTLTEAALTGYRAWMAGLSNQPPQALQEPFDDPDGDGVRNLLEYALGGHPLQSGSESYPHLAINGNNISLHYAKAANDLNYIVEVSPDLSPGSWQTLEASESFDPETGLFSKTHILQTEADRSFLRLRVETIIP